MRLQRLTLDRFGHFAGKVFDFGPAPDGADFHIIYGPNEAGKTTTMEAFLRLLYGFPQRDTYGFRHQRANLQVSAKLAWDGGTLEAARLPKQLIAPDGTALPETELAAHLGGFDLTQYRQLLCLDDETIEQGGEEIIAAKGDAGRLLFSAAAGISHLSEVLDAAQEEADAIYRKGASKRLLNALRSDLKKTEADIARLDIKPAAYRALRKAVETAAGDEHSAREALALAQKDVTGIRAKQVALPMLQQLDQLAPVIAGGAAYPQHLDIDPEALVDLLRAQANAESRAKAAQEALEKTRREAEEVALNPDLAALVSALPPLDDLHARYAGAALDLDKRKQARDATAQAMQAVLRDLGQDAGVDPMTLALPLPVLADLETTRDQLRAARQTLAHEAKELSEAKRGLDVTEAQQDPDETPLTGIADLLARHGAEGLAPRHASASEAIAQARRNADTALHALSLGGVVFDTLPDAPVTTAQADRWADLEKHLQDKQRRAVDDLEALAKERAALEARVLAQTRLADVADAAQIQTLTETRDALWQRHLAQLNPPSAQAFAAAMQALDSAVSQRLSAVSQLATIRADEAALAGLDSRMSQAQTVKDALTREAHDLAQQVSQACAPLGLSAPLCAADLASWCHQRDHAETALHQARHIAADHAETLDRAQALHDALSQQFDLINPTFPDLLDKARKRAEAERQTAEATRRKGETLRRAKSAYQDRLARHTEAQDAVDAAGTAWASLVATTLGAAMDPGKLETGLDRLRDLRELAGQHTYSARRVQSMQQDQARFAEHVCALTDRFGIGAGLPSEDAFQALTQEAERATRAKALSERLQAQCAEHLAQLDAARQSLDEIAGQAQAMATLFAEEIPTSTIPELRNAVSQAQSVIEARAERGNLLSRLLAELRVDDEDAARLSLADQTETTVAMALEQAQQKLASAQTALEQAVETRSGAQRDLSNVTSDAEVALLFEKKATLELQIEESVLRHLTLSLGNRLAGRAIDRYRDTHRSSMLRATEKAFGALTDGAYERLGTQPEKDRDVLLAFDRTGAAKRAGEMSKGTRFQLYLALRAAAYAQLPVQLPFFCDDVFETFDEDRTRAACRLMEQIGAHGQAIYLTHHRHVVEIAQQVCATPPRVHEITRADAGLTAS